MDCVVPDWPAPARVRALTTTRRGGVSTGPYASLNLAGHVGDDPSRVASNRLRLKDAFSLPDEPGWLEQVHGCDVAELNGSCAGVQVADASVAFERGSVCAVLTADCLPLLMCDRSGTRVAAVHAGWRGLLAGVVEAAVARLGGARRDLLCWLGPAIGPEAYEVGAEMRDAFWGGDSEAADAFRCADDGEHWYADLYRLARLRLARCGVDAVYGGDCCTFSEPARFFSYRRDGVTGRMATLIWLDP